ncbi:hypothetical protein E2562_034468 [Oryza meyeriana var. granulata]|uniref:Uncharacterized protein n=1 Tax=Oryza meyeriana var. granulata TaxID=110450 RepID=A0A6G1ESF0_9ORYZ|nr:hypothetical protein E2562_034468 [Oryza meyeriana var. granulata]
MACPSTVDIADAIHIQQATTLICVATETASIYTATGSRVHRVRHCPRVRCLRHRPRDRRLCCLLVEVRRRHRPIEVRSCCPVEVSSGGRRGRLRGARKGEAGR